MQIFVRFITSGNKKFNGIFAIQPLTSSELLTCSKCPLNFVIHPETRLSYSSSELPEYGTALMIVISQLPTLWACSARDSHSPSELGWSRTYCKKPERRKARVVLRFWGEDLVGMASTFSMISLAHGFRAWRRRSRCIWRGRVGSIARESLYLFEIR